MFLRSNIRVATLSVAAAAGALGTLDANTGDETIG
jgi:hypothetical protein